MPVDFLWKKLKYIIRQDAEKNSESSHGPEKKQKLQSLDDYRFRMSMHKRSQANNQMAREQYKDKIRWLFRDYHFTIPPPVQCLRTCRRLTVAD